MMYLVFFVCSLSLVNGAILSRIIGGSDASESKYPYQVSLRTKVPGYPEFHFCSGAIIDENWILTAAHCFDGRDMTYGYIVAGTNYLKWGGEKYKIHFPIVHPDYRSKGLHDDIALVRIVGSISFHERVQPVALPTENMDSSDILAAFAGWGSTSVKGQSANVLQEIPLHIMPFAICHYLRGEITQKQMCTYNGFGQGLCYGDSGGPLVLNGTQIGIASYVRPCATGYPDVHTRVWSYMDWIVEMQEKYALVFIN